MKAEEEEGVEQDQERQEDRRLQPKGLGSNTRPLKFELYELYAVILYKHAFCFRDNTLKRC